VNFVRVDEEQALYFRVYERGVEAETLSSGTGSIAAALAAAAADRVASPVACAAAGGTLMVRFRPSPIAAAVEPEPAVDVPPSEPATDAPTAEGGEPGADPDSDATANVSAEGIELPRIAEGPPLEYVDIEVEGDTRRVMEGTAAADALRSR